MFNLNQVLACPFVSENNEVSMLAAQTRSTIISLQNLKNKCGNEFVRSIDAVSNLPDMIGDAYSPLKKLQHRRRYLLSEYASAINDGTSSEFDLESWKNDIDDVEEEIRLLRINRSEAINKSSAERKTLLAMSNLLDTLNNQVDDSDSDCAKELNKSFSSNLLTLGLGVVSLAAPALATSTISSSSVSLVAGLLGKISNFKSKAPQSALKSYDRAQDTTDMACLYHEIVMKSCQVEDVEFGDIQSSSAVSFIDKLQSTSDSKKYDKILGSVEAKQARHSINALSKLLTTTIASASDNSDVFNASLFSEQVESALDKYKRRLERFYELKKFYLEGGINSASTSDKKNVNYYMTNFHMEVQSDLEASFTDVIDKDTEGNSLKSRDYFIKNISRIEQLLNNQINERSSETGNPNVEGTKAYDVYNWQPVIMELGQIRRANNTMIDMAYEHIKKAKESGDMPGETAWRQLIELSSSSNNFIADYRDWASVDPTKLSRDQYAQQIKELGTKVKNRLSLGTNLSPTIIKEKTEATLFLPLVKFSSIMKDSTSIDDQLTGVSGLLAANIESNSLSEWDKYKSGYEALKQLGGVEYSPADRRKITEVRDLFEGSRLGDSLRNGLAGIIKDAENSSNPTAIKLGASSMCYLAASLTNGTSTTVKGCSGLVANDFSKYTRKGEKPNCSYYRYYNNQKRSKYLRRISKPNLPDLELYYKGKKVEASN